MLKVRWFVAFSLSFLLFSVGTAVSAQGDLDCADFSSQEEAQAYFEAGGGSPAYNFNNLDADHDGYACENHFGYIGSPVVSQPDVADPEAPTPAEPVTELPDTGTGSAANEANVGLGLVGLSVLAAGLFTAFRLRMSSN